jgi:Flp pilus assembly protein TadG
MNLIQWTHQPKCNRQGLATVEFALVFPIVMTMSFAAIEFTRLNYLRHSTRQAAYVAARHIAVPGATSQEAIQAATDYLHAVRIYNGITVNPTLTATEVSVDVSVSVGQNSWGIGRFVSGNTAMQFTCVLKREKS